MNDPLTKGPYCGFYIGDERGKPHIYVVATHKGQLHWLLLSMDPRESKMQCLVDKDRSFDLASQCQETQARICTQKIKSSTHMSSRIILSYCLGDFFLPATIDPFMVPSHFPALRAERTNNAACWTDKVQSMRRSTLSRAHQETAN